MFTAAYMRCFSLACVNAHAVGNMAADCVGMLPVHGQLDAGSGFPEKVNDMPGDYGPDVRS